MPVPKALFPLLEHTGQLGATSASHLYGGYVRAAQPSSQFLSNLLVAPQVVRLPEDEEREHLFARFFGIPTPFLQLGTYLGLKGLSAFVVDMVTDPLTWLSGGLTGAGRAAERAGTRAVETLITGAKGTAATASRFRGLGGAAATIARTPGVTVERAMGGMSRLFDIHARVESESLKRLYARVFTQGVTKEEALGALAREKESLLSTFRTARAEGRLAKEKALRGELLGMTADDATREATEKLAGFPWTPSTEQYDAISRVIRKKGLEAGRTTLEKQIAIKEGIQEEARALVNVGDFKGFKKVMNRIMKLEPSAVGTIAYRSKKRGWADFFREATKGKVVPPLAPTLGEQAALGQRAFLKFGIPGTPFEFSLVSGQKIWTGIDKLSEKSKFVKALASGGSKAAGLIPGGKLTTAARMAKLGVPAFTKADALTVLDSGMRAVDTIHGFIPENVVEVENLLKILEADKRNARFVVSHFQNELATSLAEINDPQLIQEFLENPDDFVEPFARAGAPRHKIPLADRYSRTNMLGPIKPEAAERGFTEAHQMLGLSLQELSVHNADVMWRQGLLDQAIINYIPRIVKRKPGVSQAAFERHIEDLKAHETLTSMSAHMLERRVPVWKELKKLEEDGVLEIEKDLGVIYSEWINSSARAAANARFVDRLRTWRHTLPEAMEGEIEALEAIVSGGRKDIDDKTLAKYYTVLEDPELNRIAHRVLSMKTGKVTAEDIEALGEGTLRKSKPKRMIERGKIYLLADLAKPLKIYLKQVTPVSVGDTQALPNEKFVSALMAFNGAAKRFKLSLSAFHHMALTESALFTMGWTFLRNPVEAIRLGNRMAKNADDIVQYGIQHGLQVGPVSDWEVDTLQRALKGAESLVGRVPLIGQAAAAPIRALQRGTTAWDRVLWDYYHNSLKIFAFNEIYHKSLARFPDLKAGDIAEQVAAHVNNAFGGQVWERLWVSRKGNLIARALMLSPDWTASNLRVAADVFANFNIRRPNIPFARDLLVGNDVRAFWARQYAMRAAVIWMGLANFANFAFTSWDHDRRESRLENGHFMDGNPEGYRDQVQLPWRDEEGRRLFWRFAKQFREPMELINFWEKGGGPINFIRRKFATLPRTFITQFTGKDLFGRPIITSEDGPIQEYMARAGDLIGQFVPISVGQATGIGQRNKQDIQIALASALGAPINVEFTNRRIPRAEDAGVYSPQAIPDIMQDRAIRQGLANPDISRLLGQRSRGLPAVLPLNFTYPGSR